MNEPFYLKEVGCRFRRNRSAHDFRSFGILRNGIVPRNDRGDVRIRHVVRIGESDLLSARSARPHSGLEIIDVIEELVPRSAREGRRSSGPRQGVIAGNERRVGSVGSSAYYEGSKKRESEECPLPHCFTNGIHSSALKRKLEFVGFHVRIEDDGIVGFPPDFDADFFR